MEDPITLEEDLLVSLFDLSKERKISLAFDHSEIQDSLSFRARRRALFLANFLLDEKGQWRLKELEEVLSALKNRGYIYYPKGTNDSLLLEHFISCLERFQGDDFLQKEIVRFHAPLCHLFAENLVKNALHLPPSIVLSDVHVKRAVLSACLTPIRQSVGSCFATAPAILIQKEQMENLLGDLRALLTTGKMKRVIAGKEFAVPLSPSLGWGDLKKKIAFSDKEKFLSSPALQEALLSCHILDPSSTLQEKQKTLLMLGAAAFGQDSFLFVDEFIEKMLLSYFSVTKEQVAVFEKQEKLLVKRGELLSPLENKDASAKYLKARKIVFEQFKSQTEHPLLKAWEFSLASLSEAKMEFSRWNIYSSLGLHPKEEGGIGQIVLQFVEKKIEESNQKLEEQQRDYEIAYDKVRMAEARLKRASTDSEARRLQAELQGYVHECETCLSIRNRFYEDAGKYTSFHNRFLSWLDEKFPQYFQEIYDPEMIDADPSQYADSPAGFRLVYKHGRVDPSLWTSVHSSDEFIDVLTNFFTLTESDILAECGWESAKGEIERLLSSLILHLRTDLFLQTAMTRVKEARTWLRGTSLEKKPWAYLSGGSMESLLKIYYAKEGDPAKEERGVENAADLFVFLLDTLKAVPFSWSQKLAQDPKKALLMNSPSHAFLLKPGLAGFQKAWDNDRFSYTVVRDEYLVPAKEFFASLTLSASQIKFLLDSFFSKLPEGIPFPSSFPTDPMSVSEFRNTVLVKTKLALSPVQDLLDAFLWKSLPLVQGSDMKRRLLDLVQEKKEASLIQKIESLPDSEDPWMASSTLKQIAKDLLASVFPRPLALDIHAFIAEKAAELSLAPPRSILFADSNWAHFFFAFVFNPGSEELEVWRVNQTGDEGIPMRSWTPFFNKKDLWTVFVKADQYSSLHTFLFKNHFKKL